MFQLGADDPRTIGSYQIVGKLGEGGMGTVYKGRSRGGRSVAVKVAKPELAADPDFRGRFRTEIEAAQRVGGFHTAQVIDADPDAHPPWMTTAFIPGRTLARVVDEDGPMDEPRLRALGAALAEALQAIHVLGLVHRDLKPANIILSDDGPRVLDFGIARALEATRFTNTHVSVGTPGFFSPEQVRGDRDIGPAADVFALGAVLVHAAGGRVFGEGDSMTLMYRAVHNEPVLAALPDSLRPLAASCLAKEPYRRPTPEAVLAEVAPRDAPGPGTPPPVRGAFGPAPSAFTDAWTDDSRADDPGTDDPRTSGPRTSGARQEQTPSGPVREEPVRPDPVRPDPVRPDSVRPDSAPSEERGAAGPARFARAWVWRWVEFGLWFSAFAGLAAPMITLQAMHGNDPGSVFHEPFPLLVPVNVVMTALLWGTLRTLYPYRVTVDADGIAYRKALRTVRYTWGELGAVEPRGPSSLALHRPGGRRTAVLRWPRAGRGHQGLRAALDAHAPPALVRRGP